MCMSVLEGGIYFDELTSLPSRHLALLLLGLMLALLGAIFMGIAGFIAGGLVCWVVGRCGRVWGGRHLYGHRRVPCVGWAVAQLGGR